MAAPPYQAHSAFEGLLRQLARLGHERRRLATSLDRALIKKSDLIAVRVPSVHGLAGEQFDAASVGKHLGDQLTNDVRLLAMLPARRMMELKCLSTVLPGDLIAW